MSAKRGISFKEGLRRAFLGYALLPVAAVAALILLLLLFGSGWVLRRDNQRDSQAVSEKLVQAMTPYLREAEELSFREEMLRVLDGGSPQALYQLLYDFNNRQEVRCDFYLLDKNAALKITSTTKAPQYLQSENQFMWGILRRIQAAPGRPSVMLNRYDGGVSSECLFSTGAAVVRGGEIEGYLIFDLPQRKLLDYMSDAGLCDVVITDPYDGVGLSTNTTYVDSRQKLRPEFRLPTGSHHILGKGMYVGERELPGLGLTVRTYTSLAAYEAAARVVALVTAGLLGLLALAMYRLSDRLARQKTQAMDAILAGIRSVQDGDLGVRMEVRSGDEFEIIADACNQMVKAIEALIQQNREEARQTALAEIRQLESQFNPHFLFNTLETVRCMMKFDQKAAGDMLVSLSSLMRYSIGGRMEQVRLEQDIEYLQAYFRIMECRFGQKIRFALEVAPGAGDWVVPRLLLQPVIENAVKYGMGERDRLAVEVKISFDGPDLLAVISDDGPGIGPGELAEVRRRMEGERRDGHLGLYNVNRRIRLLYGPAYGLTVESAQGRGTRVTIRVPRKREERGGQGR